MKYSFQSSLVNPATQAEQEAGINLSNFVTPGRQQFHPSSSKVWARGSSTGGTPTAVSSYNVTSVTDTNVGKFALNFTTNFSGATAYTWVTCVDQDEGTFFYIMGLDGDIPPTASSVSFATITLGGVFADVRNWGVALFGDQ